MTVATTNFNVSPYYDDYDEDKGFLKVLFRPAYSVQARELSQLQTMLQKNKNVRILRANSNMDSHSNPPSLRMHQQITVIPQKKIASSSPYMHP